MIEARDGITCTPEPAYRGPCIECTGQVAEGLRYFCPECARREGIGTPEIPAEPDNSSQNVQSFV